MVGERMIDIGHPDGKPETSVKPQYDKKSLDKALEKVVPKIARQRVDNLADKSKESVVSAGGFYDITERFPESVADSNALWQLLRNLMVSTALDSGTPRFPIVSYKHHIYIGLNSSNLFHNRLVENIQKSLGISQMNQEEFLKDVEQNVQFSTALEFIDSGKHQLKLSVNTSADGSATVGFSLQDKPDTLPSNRGLTDEGLKQLKVIFGRMKGVEIE